MEGGEGEGVGWKMSTIWFVRVLKYWGQKKGGKS
jgi:hypothetical protein